MNKNKKFSVRYNKSWASWGAGFLLLAKQNMNRLREEENIGKQKNGRKSIYMLSDGFSIVASIWNIKHGIELLIKSLGIKINKQYFISHDLNFLIQELDSIIKNCCEKKILNKFKKIVYKYYNCEFSKKTYFLDTENTLFKYPEIKGEKNLDYSFVHDFKKRDLDKMIKEIDEIIDLHWEIYNHYSFYKNKKQ